jgi:hypothetical protein
MARRGSADSGLISDDLLVGFFELLGFAIQSRPRGALQVNLPSMPVRPQRSIPAKVSVWHVAKS